MTKTLTAEMRAENLKPEQRIGFLVEIDHPVTVINLWSGVGSIPWDGKTWTGVGKLGSIKGLGETAELRVKTVTYELIGANLDADALSLVTQDVRGRAIKAWHANIDERGEVVPDPVLIDDSIMDFIETTEDKDLKQVVRINAQSSIFNFRKPTGLTLSDEQQQADFPGDTGFDRITEVVDKELIWNRT